MTVDEYIKNLEYVKANLRLEEAKVVSNNKDLILDLNREQLYEKGINNDGTPITPEYRPFTKRLKQSVGAIWSHVTLFHTGQFYRGFDLVKTGNGFSVFSRDSKSSLLQDKYGSKIFGLTESNEKILNDLLQKEMEVFIAKYL